MQRRKIIILFILILLVLPTFLCADNGKKTNSKISFDFIDADIKNVLKILADLSSKNIVIAEDVKGKITIKIDNIDWEEAFDIILKNQDLTKIEDENIIRVVTKKRFFDERKRDRDERLEFLREKEAKQKLEEEHVTETVFINYVNASDMYKIIAGEDSKDKRMKGLLSSTGSAIPVKWSNSLIIKDTRERIDEIKKRIKEQDIAPAQVQIEARIVYANSDFSRELGIKWNAIWQRGNSLLSGASGFYHSFEPGSTYPHPLPFLVNEVTQAFKPAGSLTLMLGGSSMQLDAILSALEVDGKGRVISNPKIITTDNKAALIKQGYEIPYETVSQSGTNIQFKEAVLSLEVTPQVTKDGNVNMKIKATKDRPTSIGMNVPMEKKETSTEVMIKDGDTVVIGGIYELAEESANEGIPLLKNIPLLGWMFFDYDKKLLQKKELLIFVTPTIVRNKYQDIGVIR